MFVVNDVLQQQQRWWSNRSTGAGTTDLIRVDDRSFFSRHPGGDSFASALK